MDYGLKPLGREKLWLWLMLVPTIIGLAVWHDRFPAGDAWAESSSIGT